MDCFVYLLIIILIMMGLVAYTYIYFPILSLIAGFDVGTIHTVCGLVGPSNNGVAVWWLLVIAGTIGMGFGTPIGVILSVYYGLKKLAEEKFKDQEILNFGLKCLAIGVISILVLGIIMRYWHSTGACPGQ